MLNRDIKDDAQLVVEIQHWFYWCAGTGNDDWEDYGVKIESKELVPKFLASVRACPNTFSKTGSKKISGSSVNDKYLVTLFKGCLYYEILLVSQTPWDTLSVYPLGIDYVAVLSIPAIMLKKQIMNLVHSSELGAASRIFSRFCGVSIRNIDNTDTINSRWLSHWIQSLVHQIRENSTARIILGGSGFTVFHWNSCRHWMRITASSVKAKVTLLCRHWKTMPGCNLCRIVTKETARMLRTLGNEIKRALIRIVPRPDFIWPKGEC